MRGIFGDEVLDFYLIGHVPESAAQEVIQILLGLAGEGAHIHFQVSVRRQHVDGAARAQDGLGDGGVAKGVGVGVEVAELGVVPVPSISSCSVWGSNLKVRTKPSQISLEAVGGSAAAMRRATSPIFTMAKSLP